MEKDKKTLDIKTVCECCHCLGGQTLHPLVSLINLERRELEEDAVKFEFYAILLIEECPDGCGCCGRKYYDFSEATMVFLTPGEMFRMNKEDALPPKGWLLAFHPDLLFRTTLRNHIRNYTFFYYSKEEALHLSCRETSTVTCLLSHIEEELHHPIDTHTSIIISRHIELLLDYCSRYYERQFITRENKNKALLCRLDKIVRASLEAGNLPGGGLPTASYCAGALGLSPAYFSDMLRFETGKTWEEYFEFKRLDEAKLLLWAGQRTPSEVARMLGYPNVQSFSLLFKKVVGVPPGEYHAVCILRNKMA